jgi:hypothetical protein
VNLEPLDVRDSVRRDPRGFLAQHYRLSNSRSAAGVSPVAGTAMALVLASIYGIGLLELALLAGMYVLTSIGVEVGFIACSRIAHSRQHVR